MSSLKRAAARLLPQGLAWRLGWIARYGLGARRAYVTRAIPSFMYDEEEIALHRVARSLPPGAQVAEIGAWIGRSSINLANALRGSGGHLYCIDPFLGRDVAMNDGRATAIYGDVLDAVGTTQDEAFRSNVSAHGATELVTQVQGYSHEVARDWSRQLDLLFIDADHSYESVRRDLDDWTPFVKPGGWLVMHDVWFEQLDDPDLFYEGPARAVRESILNHPEWGSFHSTRSLFQSRRLAANASR